MNENYSSPAHLKLFAARRQGHHAVLKNIEANGETILNSPTVICLGAAIPENTPREQYSQQNKFAVLSTSQMTGIDGRGDVRLYTIANDVTEKQSKFKARRNNMFTPNTDPAPFEQRNYEFALKFLVPEPDANHPVDANEWSKRFSRLVISSFSAGGMEGAEILNACRKRLEEIGFSRQEAKHIMSHAKQISIGDPSDMSFYESGATIYRILNQYDRVAQTVSHNLTDISEWLRDSKTEKSNDVRIISSDHYPGQNTVLISRQAVQSANKLLIANSNGEWFDEKKGEPNLNIIQDPANHKITSYVSHGASAHGFISPAIVQNLHMNAINHACRASEAESAGDVPDVKAMLMTVPKEQILFRQDVKDNIRALWPVTSEAAEAMGFQERIEKGRIKMHEKSNAI